MELDMIELVDQPKSRETSPSLHSDDTDPTICFGLQENPFLDSVNPDYFFRTEAHEEACLQMKKCIEDHISMGLVTARSGTGKTLLTQILLQELDQNRYRPALVLAYPRISRSALLRELANELEIEGLPARASLHKLMTAVQQRIYELHEENKKPVFMIDEVHFLGGDTLHLLRTLSNIETARRKLVTILLFGEETFLRKLDEPRYRAILSRTFIRSHLRPLTPGEVEQYIKFRCLMAGGGNNLFGKDTFERIREVTEGVPREINRLCHNALERAASRGLSGIDRTFLEEVIETSW